MDGIIVVYKEKGFTSFDVVAKLRGILKQKKIGHTGTLDPDATGVLPVCLGCGTKLCDMLTDTVKTYEAKMILGIATDTQDITGKILCEKDVLVKEDEVKKVISRYIGNISQIPPMYSALKVNGQKLCDLARAGKTIERSARQITIYDIEILHISIPNISMKVTCSKGTYIRTLCHDIGQELKCGAAMTSLVRTHTSGFDISEAKTLAQIEQLMSDGKISEILHPVDEAFQTMESFIIKEDVRRAADNGNELKADAFVKYALMTKPNEKIRVYREDGFFYGIYQYTGEVFKPVKMFFCEALNK